MMKLLPFQVVVLILLKYDLVLSQGMGLYFERIDDKDGYQLSVVGKTRPMHRCSLKNECNYVVETNENGAMVLKDSIRSTSDYLAVWKKISNVGKYYLLR